MNHSLDPLTCTSVLYAGCLPRPKTEETSQAVGTSLIYPPLRNCKAWQSRRHGRTGRHLDGASLPGPIPAKACVPWLLRSVRSVQAWIDRARPRPSRSYPPLSDDPKHSPVNVPGSSRLSCCARCVPLPVVSASLPRPTSSGEGSLPERLVRRPTGRAL
jgi:hypothetical protein